MNEELKTRFVEEMQKSFSDLCQIHSETILNRAYNFTLEDELLPVTFKFKIANAGKVVKIIPSISMPGQKVTDDGTVKMIDVEQPELLSGRKKK